MSKPTIIARGFLVAGLAFLLCLAACSTSQSSPGHNTTSVAPQNAAQLQASFDVGNIAPPSADSQHISVFAKFTTTAGKDAQLGTGTSITCNGVKLTYNASGAYNSHLTTAYYAATIPTITDAYHFVYTANGTVTKADIPVPTAPTITSPVANAHIPIGHVTIKFAADTHAIALLAFATDSSGDTTSGTLSQADAAQSGTYALNTGDFPIGKGAISLTELESAPTGASDFAHTTANIVVTTTIAVIWTAA